MADLFVSLIFFFNIRESLCFLVFSKTHQQYSHSKTHQSASNNTHTHVGSGLAATHSSREASCGLEAWPLVTQQHFDTTPFIMCCLTVSPSKKQYSIRAIYSPSERPQATVLHKHSAWLCGSLLQQLWLNECRPGFNGHSSCRCLHVMDWSIQVHNGIQYTAGTQHSIDSTSCSCDTGLTLFTIYSLKSNDVGQSHSVIIPPYNSRFHSCKHTLHWLKGQRKKEAEWVQTDEGGRKWGVANGNLPLLSFFF